MIITGARDKLVRSHETVEKSWIELCDAQTEFQLAKNKLSKAEEDYLSRLKGWRSVVEICTPGPAKEKP